jgi:hypothetical protein
VNFQRIELGKISVSGLMIFALAAISMAQDMMKRELPLTGSNSLYCAGFIQTAPVNTSFEVVGAEDEADQHVFAQGDNLVVNFGASRGAKVGDTYSVIRPRGRVETRWTRKNNLGFYVQEVGLVEIVTVKNEFSVARVKTSCDNLLLGDLLTPMVSRDNLMQAQRPKLEVFGDPSGKASGRIVLARDGQEMVSRDQIVFVDLGREDNVQVGDYLTVYRPLGTGNIYDRVQRESVRARDEGYQSNEYRGGKFSNQAPRKKGGEARGEIVTTENAKSRRPNMIRQVVGELVVLNVREKTATAMVVRTTQEVHTGDYVELQ